MNVNLSDLMTYREIRQQPAVWRTIAQLNLEDLHQSIDWQQRRIIITGAGTSAFVGKCAASFWRQNVHERVEAIATTDLVIMPQRYLINQPTLLISCARSGNSPESLASVEIAEQLIDDIIHIFITCNKDGALCHYAVEHPNTHLILLPPETNDQGFAMTTSFTATLLTLLRLANPSKLTPAMIEQICARGEQLLASMEALCAPILQIPFDRYVCLGDGPLAGLAQEAALKLAELTAGRVATLYETALGLRHGPKTFINAQTLVVLLLSNEAYARRYQLHLLDELLRDGEAAGLVVISGTRLKDFPNIYQIVTGDESLLDDLLCFNAILFGQMLAVLKSRQLGIHPDNPVPSGTVNRVVQGVAIYPYDQTEEEVQ